MVYKVYTTNCYDDVLGANFVKEDDLKDYLDKCLEKYNDEDHDGIKFEIYPQF